VALVQQVVTPRIRVAKLAWIAGLLLFGVVPFGAPVVIALPSLMGLDGIVIAILVLLSAIPAAVASAFLATLVFYGLLAWRAARRGGLFVVDPQHRRITDCFGRSWTCADHAPGILVRGRGGNPYSLVLTDIAAPKERQCHIMPGLERAFATLWPGHRPMRTPAMVLPLFILTEIDAILATQR
jgi:hypothetical protein